MGRNKVGLTHKVLERNHRFMKALFIALGAMMFGSIRLCAMGYLDPFS